MTFLTLLGVDAARRGLRLALPGAKPSHIAEALAMALGFPTHSRLIYSLALDKAKAGKVAGTPFTFNERAFLGRLAELGWSSFPFLSRADWAGIVEKAMRTHGHDTDAWLDRLLATLGEPDVSAVICVGGATYIERDGGLVNERTERPSGALGKAASKLARETGIELKPVTEGYHPDGFRFCYLSPDTDTPEGTLTLLAPPALLGLSDLVDRHGLSLDMADYLQEAVLSGANIIVSGSVNTGRTTMCNALMMVSNASYGKRPPNIIHIHQGELSMGIRERFPNLRLWQAGYKKDDRVPTVQDTLKACLRFGASTVVCDTCNVNVDADALTQMSIMSSHVQLIWSAHHTGKEAEEVTRRTCARPAHVVVALHRSAKGRRFVESITEILPDGDKAITRFARTASGDVHDGDGTGRSAASWPRFPYYRLPRALREKARKHIWNGTLRTLRMD